MPDDGATTHRVSTCRFASTSTRLATRFGGKVAFSFWNVKCSANRYNVSDHINIELRRQYFKAPCSNCGDGTRVARTITQRSDTMLEDDGLEPLLIRHAEAMRMIGCKVSHYWGLVRKGKIIVVEKGRAGHAYVPSVRAYVEQLLADAENAMAAAGGRLDPEKSAQMVARWAVRESQLRDCR